MRVGRRTFVLIGLALAAAAPAPADARLADAVAHAHLGVPQVAGPEVASGLTCGLSAVTDPTIENGKEVYTGVVWGGPLVSSSPGGTVSMTCTVHVLPANTTHAGADATTPATSAASLAAVVPPTAVHYLAPTGQPVYICTEITENGRRWYWDGVAEAWSPSPAVPCFQVIVQGVPPVG